MSFPTGLARAVAVVALLALSVPAFGQDGKLSAAGEGRRLWLKLNCYGCHGMDGGGGMGPGLRGEGLSFSTIASRVYFGGSEGMPSFRAHVTDTDVQNLAAYIDSLGGRKEPIFNLWWKPRPRR